MRQAADGATFDEPVRRVCTRSAPHVQCYARWVVHDVVVVVVGARTINNFPLLAAVSHCCTLMTKERERLDRRAANSANSPHFDQADDSEGREVLFWSDD